MEAIFISFTYLLCFQLRKIQSGKVHCSLINEHGSGKSELTLKEIFQTQKQLGKEVIAANKSDAFKLCDVLHVYFTLKSKNEIMQEKQYTILCELENGPLNSRDKR